MTTGSSARSWRLGLEAIIILGPALACSSIALHGSPNQPDAAGFTPLMHAARAGDLDRVRGLLRRGADPNYQGRKVKRYGLLFPFVEESWEDEPFESQTPLMLASAAGHAPVVRVLTGAGADPNLGTRLGQPGRTPLWFAAGAGHREASLALLEAGASRTSWATYQAVGLARSNGHLELARTLVQQGAGVRVDDMGGQMEVTGWSSMLSEAARDGQHELVRDLLQAGVDVRGERGGTTLRAAAKEGRAEVVRLLLAAGAAPDGAGLPVGSTALGLAAGQGHAECVRVLARAGADPNAAQPFAGAPPLVLAAQRGHLEVLRVLLEHGADVESRDDRGQSALARAAARNDREMMDLLQSRGASPRDVLAPELLAAVKTGDVRRVAALLARGAPVDVREDHARRTPLMLAALDGRRDLLRLLLRSGADVNAQDASGQSALLLAVVNGSLQIVRDLIAAGARVGTDPRANPIPLAVARKRIDLVGALAAAADPEARAQGLRTASEKGVVEAQKLLTRGLDGAAL